MDRRTFLSVMGVAAPLATRQRWSLQGSDRIDRIGLQLYTVRDQMAFSVEKTLHEVARDRL